MLIIYRNNFFLVTYLEPPWFRARSERVQVLVDSTAMLNCHARGDKPLKLTWAKNNEVLPLLSR